jgi:MFS family permease
MSDDAEVPWWSTVSFFVACVLTGAVGGVLVDRAGPQLWTGVLLLACSAAAFAWTAAHNAPEPGAAKRTPREILLGRPRQRRGGARRMWSWRNYPFFIAFVSFMLTTREFQLLYGYWQALLLTTGAVLAAVASQRSWAKIRGKR